MILSRVADSVFGTVLLPNFSSNEIFLPNASIRNLQMPEWVFNCFPRDFSRIALQRLRNEVLRAEAYGERQGQNNAAEENTEGHFNDATGDAEILKSHCYGEHDDQPFHAHA